MAALIVFLLIVLAVAVSAGFYAVGQQKKNKPGIGPGQNYGNPEFRIHSPKEPDFKIISVSGRPSPPIPGRQPQNFAPRMPAATASGFNLQEVSQNLTAICKLTGRKAADCNCDRHKAKK